MSSVLTDSVDTRITIGGTEWRVAEATVELSRNRTPNYVDVNKMIPTTASRQAFDDAEELVGQSFSIYADTQFVSERDTDAEEETLLFSGNVANASPAGNGTYEAIAYDPSQQALNTGQGGGSILQQRVSLSGPFIDYDELRQDGAYIDSGVPGVTYEPGANLIRASDALRQVLDQTPIPPAQRNIQLQSDGVTVGSGDDSFTGAQDLLITFKRRDPTIGSALSKIARETNSFWWFDKRGEFYFGIPDPTVHELTLITDTSAGLTTPPYQSIRVIGADTASTSGYAAATQNAEDPLIKEANIIIGPDGNPTANTGSQVPKEEILGLSPEDKIGLGTQDDLIEPTFEYRSNEIITERQANNVLNNLAEKIGEQYASGKVTVVGFPEVSIFDVIIMPHANTQQQDVGNYQSEQPMGGSIFGVYKVVHKLNGSDGFLTDIHVAGMVGPASVLVSDSDVVQATGTGTETETPTTTSAPDRGFGL